MIKILTKKKAKQLDLYLSQKLNIPTLVLMENAGIRVAEFVKYLLKDKKDKRIVVFCGKGNNAGDGLVTSRQLICDGFKVDTYLLSDYRDLSYETALNLNILRNISSRIKLIKNSIMLKKIRFSQYAVLIDAIFGIGLSGEVKGIYKEVIEKINSLEIPIVSIDIPSGLDADRGVPLGVAVRADYTITLMAPKRGLLVNQGPYFAGKILVKHIGFKIDD